MTGDVDADAATPDPAASQTAGPPTALETVARTVAVATAALERLGRRLDADSRAEDANVEKVARATGGLARAAIAVLALDARLREALALAASPPSEPTDEADMDDADEGSWAEAAGGLDGDGGGDNDGGGAEPAPAREPDPDLAYRLARMAWRLGRGGEVPPSPPERAGEAGGALGLPGP